MIVWERDREGEELTAQLGSAPKTCADTEETAMHTAIVLRIVVFILLLVPRRQSFKRMCRSSIVVFVKRERRL